MFLDKQYTQEYYTIIKKNQIKTQGLSVKKIKIQFGYTEKHHIIPKALGGEDKKANIVYLPANDHYKCHRLLIDMTNEEAHGKMWSALWRMMNKQSRNQKRDIDISAEEYAQARIAHATAHSKRMAGAGNPFYNHKHTNKTIKAMSLAKKGKTYEEIFGVKEAKIMRARRSAEQLGKKKGKQKTSKCEYCGVVGGTSIMKRWHGNKCKNR